MYEGDVLSIALSEAQCWRSERHAPYHGFNTEPAKNDSAADFSTLLHRS
jgi:hypothetical protein